MLWSIKERRGEGQAAVQRGERKQKEIQGKLRVICWNVERETHKPTGRGCTSWTRVIQSWKDRRHPVQPPLWRGKTDAERGMPRFDWSHRANPRRSVVNRKRERHANTRAGRKTGGCKNSERTGPEWIKEAKSSYWMKFVYVHNEAYTHISKYLFWYN